MRQRQPRQRDEPFLVFIRSKPCCICGAQAEAAHIRMGCHDRGKPHAGIGEKPDDRWCTPLCPHHHRNGRHSQHSMGERQFWQRMGLDPFQIAEQLYAEFAAIRPTPTPAARLIKRRIKKSLTPPMPRKMISLRTAKRIWPNAPIRKRSVWPKGRKLRSRK